MIKCHLNFREPCLDDADFVHRYVVHALQSDLAFPNLYLLKNKYGTEILFHMEHLFRRFTGNGRLSGYAFPTGINNELTDACIKAIEADAKARNEELKFCLLTQEQAAYLEKIYGPKAQIKCDRGDADYLYKRDDLAELPGTLYHKKRTHVNKFLRNYPSAEFKILTPENKNDALKVAGLWLNSQVDSPALQHEYRAIENALFHMEQLKMTGGLVYVQDSPVAMALCSTINNRVTDIHYEKCIPEFRDAYAFINREIASCAETEWINREEDLNIEGLRTAKLSYHPSLILQKYTATIYVD